MIDTKNSINENGNNSMLLKSSDDEESQKKIKKIPRKMKNTIIKQKKIAHLNENKNKEISMTFINLFTKGIFMHIDKITLIVMYLVSCYTINLIHVILVFILIFHIIAPGKLNGYYNIITLVFQLLYLIEFLIDLLKIQLFDSFENYNFFFFIAEIKSLMILNFLFME